MKKFLDAFMLWLMAFLMTALVALALWQVFSRFVLNDPSTFTEELLRYTLIWSTMLGAGYAFVKDSHIALTLLTDKVKSGPVKVFMNVFIEVVICFFAVAVLLIGGIKLCANNMSQFTPVLRLSKGMVYSCVPLLGLIIVLVKLGEYSSLLAKRFGGGNK